MSTSKPDAHEEDFETLFEESMTRMDSLEPGQLIETTVVSISDDCVFLELNGKSEGQLDLAEMTDDDGAVTVQVGDRIKAFFLKRDHGELLFTTRISGDKAAGAILENAFENGIPVEGTVEKEIKGGFEIRIGDARAFCPFSQMGLTRVEDTASLLGKQQTFKIIEFKENGRNILVSSRAILKAERDERISELKTSLKEGMTVKGTVVKVQNFGAFVDIGGVQALLPISEISRSRVEDIKAELSPGQEVEAAILSLDWDRDRIALSMKALQADPWENARSKYPAGSKHNGEVVRITNFGAFVSLEPGLDGLIHISEMKTDSREYSREDILKTGQKLEVQILSVDPQRQRISLKPATAQQQDREAQKYLESESDTDTYNPFANLLKSKEKRN